MKSFKLAEFPKSSLGSTRVEIIWGGGNGLEQIGKRWWIGLTMFTFNLESTYMYQLQNLVMIM